MEIVFATHNMNKFKEVQQMMPSGFKLLSLTDLGFFDEIEETATTLEGNAKLKALHIYNLFNRPCFADDTGLEVTFLNGMPGVYTARYAGSQKNDKANMAKLLSELKGVSNREARFRTVFTLIRNDQIFYFEGICKGGISEINKGHNGFGYDPVFIPTGHDKTFAELDMEAKNQLSHRAKALKQLIDFLNKI